MGNCDALSPLLLASMIAAFFVACSRQAPPSGPPGEGISFAGPDEAISHESNSPQAFVFHHAQRTISSG